MSKEKTIKNDGEKRTRGPAKKIEVNKEIFKHIVKSCGYSIRKLGASDNNNISCTERTIRRSLEEGRMTPRFLNEIAKYINVKPELLSGELHKRAEKYNDDILKQIYLNSLTKEKHPFYTKRKNELWSFSENGFVENILALYDVSLDQFNDLDLEKQYEFQHDLIRIITPVMFDYFTIDSYGNDAYPNFYKALDELENWRDSVLEREYANTILREKFTNNPPKGYSIDHIRKMSPDRLIDLDMDLHDSNNKSLLNKI